MKVFEEDIQQCLKVLTEGGIILYPTDTVWGLGCDATNDVAVKRLTGLKGKEEDKGLIVLLASERDVLQYVTQPDLQAFDYLQKATKPTTVIYAGGAGVANGVLAKDGSIAIRLVKDEFCRHLVKRFRRPVVSTSANFHGKSAPNIFAEIDTELMKRVDYIVKYRQNDAQVSPPSAIIKWNTNQLPTIIRL
jgi:L-threonylcarbamoyladenylate synthase